MDGAEAESYTWYRSTSGSTGTFQEVTPVKVTGNDYNVNGADLNASLDYKASGSDDTTVRFYYYVEVVAGG